MNKSIRILNLPITMIKQLEEHNIYKIIDLLHTNIDDLGFVEKESTVIKETLEKYKEKELLRDLGGIKPENKYQYLDNKYPLDSLNLSIRSYNALISNNIDTISKLLKSIEDMEIYSLENLGSKSIVQVLSRVNHIVQKEKLYNTIPIFEKNHSYDDLTIQQMGFSQGAISSLIKLKLETMGKIRQHYISGKLSELFNYKTLKVIIGEFSKYITYRNDNNYFFFKNYLIEKKLGKIKISDLNLIVSSPIDVEAILKTFENRVDIIIDNGYIRLPYLKEKLQEVNLKKESEDILIERFSGQTLQAVADKFQKTRERIRQIVRDRMLQISLFYEESFVKEYNKFVWHPEVFKKLFELDDFSFNVVKYLGTKFSFEEEYVFPEDYVIKLINNKIIKPFSMEEFKISLPDVFQPRITIYGKSIEKMSKRGFLEYVIEHYIPRSGMHKFKIIAKANKVAEENNLDYHYDKYIDIVTNTIQGLQNIRYYDYNKITEEVLDKLKQILFDVDSVYSCTYFYQKYQKLMEEVDISDGYELHFVLRRYFAKSEEFAETIDFNRQPMIAIKGKTFADVIIEKWQKLTQPVNLDEFAENLINNHGYHQGTLINVINITLGDYISLRTLYNNKPEIKPEILKQIKTILVDDFYELLELAEILEKNNIKQEDYSYFSNFWLKDLGYKTHDVNYIIKEEYSSLKHVFFTKVLSKDIYLITEKDHKMRETTLILFIETLRQEYQAFLTKKNKLISLKYLESKGISEKDIRDYVAALAKYLPKETFFTYDSLLLNKYYETNPIFAKMEGFKLGKDLMVDFIRNVPGIKKTTKGDLFRISRKQTTVVDFLEYIEKTKHIADKKILRQYVKEKYGISVRNSML